MKFSALSSILVAFAFITSAQAATSLTCLDKKQQPLLTAEDIQVSTKEVTLINVKFQLNSHLGSTNKSLKSKMSSDRRSLTFDVSTLGMYDRSIFIVPVAALATTNDFKAALEIYISGSAGKTSTVVDCKLGR